MSILRSGAGSRCRPTTPSKACTMSFRSSWAGPIITCTTSSSEMSCMACPRPKTAACMTGTRSSCRQRSSGERVFQYLYDYGDGWCCVVVLEAIAPTVPGVVYPRLVEGARHGPPEDVGGPSGYGEFLEAIADPKHERHAELLEWCGGDFDPQQFNVNEINRRIASLAPRKNTRRKTTKPATG